LEGSSRRHKKAGGGLFFVETLTIPNACKIERKGDIRQNERGIKEKSLLGKKNIGPGRKNIAITR